MSLMPTSLQQALLTLTLHFCATAIVLPLHLMVKSTILAVTSDGTQIDFDTYQPVSLSCLIF